MIATPVTSLQVRERFQHALRYYDDFGECMFCQMLEEELQDQSRIVMVSEHFVALELYASPAPFSTHIYPRRHMANFSDVSAAEISDLARMLRSMLAKLYHGLADPDFNFTIRSAPGGQRRREVLSLVCERHAAADARGRFRVGFGNVYQHGAA